MPDLSSRQKRTLVATVVIIVAAVATAWALQSLGSTDDYKVTVVRDGSAVATYSLTDIAKMPARTVVMQDQEQEGPPLLDVLERAGIRGFDEVKVVGMGARDDGVIVLSADEIDRDVLLDIAERGTTKLCGPDIAFDDRVRDVERIEVR